MRTYCPGDTIDLAVFACKGEPFKQVVLSRIRPCRDIVKTPLPVTPDTYIVTLPDKVCAGVWRLTVTTSCGCHSVLIGIKCATVVFEHQREITNVRPVGKVCCEQPPAPQPPPVPKPIPTPPGGNP